MRIVVCVKQIYDPEVSPRYFRLDPETNRPIGDDTETVMDSYAENALETAIQLRDRIPGATVTALCVGDETAEEALRRALSFTADAAVRIWDPQWKELDGQAVGRILAEAIRVLDGAQLVLTGYQAGDIEEGLVGPVIAAELGMPCFGPVLRLEAEQDRIQAACETDNGHVRISIPVPAVCTVVSSEDNVPRLPKVKDVRLARMKPIRLLTADDIRLEPEKCAAGVRLLRAYTPEQDVACEILSGQDGAELARQLTDKFIALKLV